MTQIVCNTRCLGNAFTGMQRYTTEILNRLPNIERMAPSEKMVGKWGHVWEQFILPVQARGKLIWSPANAGIIFAPARQVITLHDLAMLSGPDSKGLPLRTKYNCWMLPRLLNRVEGILTVSEYSKQEIIKQFNFSEDRILATPLGVNHDRFHPYTQTEIEAVRNAYSLKEGYILTVGSGSARKNLKGLLAAWTVAQESIPEPVELVITGDAAMYGKAFDGTEVPVLPPRTRLLGRVSDKDLPVLMAAAGVFAFPSLFEGFGLPPLEAMSCGTPCVVSNVTSLPEVVGDAALLVNPLSTEEMASGLVELCTNPVLAKEYRAKGLARAATFTWEETAKKTFEFLSMFN